MWNEAAPTPFDLRWRMFSIPVRVHPFFWIMALLLGPREPRLGLCWVAAVFVSILIHELGHAIAAKAYGWSPSILLYSFGGLAQYQHTSGSPWRRIAVAFAGPLAGFLLAGLLLALLFLGMHASPDTVQELLFNRDAADDDRPGYLAIFLDFMLFINIWWGLMNLLPVYPLDGGQIARTFLLWLSPWRGDLWATRLSLATACIVVVVALMQRQFYVAILFGLLGVQEYLRYVQRSSYRSGP